MSADDEKRALQRRRIYLEDRLEDIDLELNRFADEDDALKDIISRKKSTESVSKAQRRLNYIRLRRGILQSERVEASTERKAIVKKLREMKEATS